MTERSLPLYRLQRRFYRYTILTTPRGWTQDELRAARSRWVYDSEEEYGNPGWWTTSLLGYLNGLLPVVGLKLVGDVTEPVELTGADGVRRPYRLLLGWRIRFVGWRPSSRSS